MYGSVATSWGRERRLAMMRVIERGEGYYDAHEAKAGKVYRWRPIRQCETYYRSIASEEFAARRSLENENTHPWRSLHYFAYVGSPL
jgi:hypothetical protein